MTLWLRWKRLSHGIRNGMSEVRSKLLPTIVTVCTRQDIQSILAFCNQRPAVLDDYVRSDVSYVCHCFQSGIVDHPITSPSVWLYAKELYIIFIQVKHNDKVANRWYVVDVNNMLLNQKPCLTSIMYDTCWIFEGNFCISFHTLGMIGPPRSWKLYFRLCIFVKGGNCSTIGDNVERVAYVFMFITVILYMKLM